MADVLQEHGWDTTRALVESGGDGMADREYALNTGGGDTSKIEMIVDISGTPRHFPSEERLATAISGFSSVEAISSGAEIIGVADNSWTYITGDVSLQDCIQSIEDRFALLPGAADALLRDGSLSPTGDFDWDGYDISNVGALEIDTSITMTDDAWIGLGSGAGRIVFTDETTDGLNFMNCNIGIGAAALATSSSFTSVTLGGNAFIMAHTTLGASKSLHIAQNAQYDTDNSFEYISTDEASVYFQSGGEHRFRIAASGNAGDDISWVDAFYILNSGNVLINETAADTKTTLGLTISQGAADDLLIAGQSSDVAHGFTTYADADTYFGLMKNVAANGGVRLMGFAEGTNTAMRIEGFITTAHPATEAVQIMGAETDGGTGAQAIGNDDMLVGIVNYNTTKAVFMGSGTLSIGGVAPDSNMTAGVNVYQGAADDFVFTAQSSDVNHSFTDLADADTFVAIKKASTTTGGGAVYGYSSSDTDALALIGVIGTESASTPAVEIIGFTTNGATGSQALAAGSQILRIGSNGSSYAIVYGNANIYTTGSMIIGSGGAVDSNMTQGLTIGQGASDNLILALQSSDAGHPFTDYADTDTFGAFQKNNATYGGLSIMGFTDTPAAHPAIHIRGFQGNESSGDAAILISGYFTDAGTGVTDLDATSLALQVKNNATALLSLYGDGDGAVAGIWSGIGGLRTKRYTNDVSNPPTDAELDSAIGAPSAMGVGYIAIVDDNDAGANVYLVVSTGTDADKWWQIPLVQCS